MFRAPASRRLVHREHPLTAGGVGAGLALVAAARGIGGGAWGDALPRAEAGRLRVADRGEGQYQAGRDSPSLHEAGSEPRSLMVGVAAARGPVPVLLHCPRRTSLRSSPPTPITQVHTTTTDDHHGRPPWRPPMPHAGAHKVLHLLTLILWCAGSSEMEGDGPTSTPVLEHAAGGGGVDWEALAGERAAALARLEAELAGAEAKVIVLIAPWHDKLHGICPHCVPRPGPPIEVCGQNVELHCAI
jgi:hypothetical protein